MKVLVVTNMYPNPLRLHSGRFIQDYVQSLKEMGLEVEVFFTNPKVSRFRYLTDLAPLRRALRNGFDIVHAQHTYCMFQLRAAGAFARSRPPIVLTCHEGEAGIPLELRDPYADPLKKLVYSANLKRRAVTMADEIVLVNERLRQQLGLSAPCPIIPAAVNLDRFRPMDSADARQRLGIDSQVPVVLFPSDAAHRGFGKGVDMLERALQELQESVHLIVGGTIPPDQMPLYINAADVVVQTSRYESGPIVVKEAMACSKPIVSTDVGDVRWLFGGLPGHLIVASEPAPIAGAISRALRFRGPTSGRSRLEQLGLTLQETARRYLEIYENLLQHHTLV